jgi:hypothetical protein
MPDVDVKNRHPAFFLFATLQRWGVAFSGVRYDEPAFPTSQPAFVRLLSRFINGSLMSSLFRVLLLAVLCCSPLLVRAEDPFLTRLKYGTWGFDLAGMDSATKPGDDFFRFANGIWIDKTQIPPDKPA